MAIWIVTTGNRDIQLKTDYRDRWSDLLYEKRTSSTELGYCDNFDCLIEQEETKNKSEDEKQYLAPARVLGIVYDENEPYYQENSCYDNLVFPLLDVFVDFFNSNKQEGIEPPEKIIVLLTNQTNIYEKNGTYLDDIENKSCPFWQDTSTLEPLFKSYFLEKMEIEPLFWYIEPKSEGKKGIDHWDEMLDRVKNIFKEKLSELEFSPKELVYVSHQAGTPAISSAVQFLTIGQFERVKFLVSNKYYDEGEWKYKPELISSSKYWHGLQLQKGKQLIAKGIPGAALELLQDLQGPEPKEPEHRNDEEQNRLAELIEQTQEFVDRFNIKATGEDKKTKEFEPELAIQRVRDTLDLIEIFFEQENYLQGIILLSAAHETFVKAALRKKIAAIDFTIAKTETGKDIKVGDWIVWNEKGLILSELEGDKEFDASIIDVFKKTIHFPFSLKELKDIVKRNVKGNYFRLKDSQMLEWLHELEKFEDWGLLKLTLEHGNDLRNQFVHSLRGVEKKDVLKYLYGYKNDETGINIEESVNIDESKVDKVYREQVKQPFIETLYALNLIEDSSIENYLKQKFEELRKKYN